MKKSILIHKLSKDLLLNISGIVLTFLIIYALIVSLGLQVGSFFSINIPVETIALDLIYSFIRVTVIVLLGWLAAIVIGAIMNNNSSVRKLTTPLINLIRHISPFAWFPFAIVWFGLGERPIAFVLFITIFFPALIAAKEVFSQIPTEYLDEAKVCGANMFQLFFFIEIPLTLIPMVNLLRILWGLGWTTVIAVEMLGTAVGLGYRLLEFRYLLFYEEMIIYIVVMGAVGIFIDYLLAKVVNSLT